VLAHGAHAALEETQCDDPRDKGAVSAYETKALQTAPPFGSLARMCSNRHEGDARTPR